MNQLKSLKEVVNFKPLNSIEVIRNEHLYNVSFDTKNYVIYIDDELITYDVNITTETLHKINDILNKDKYFKYFWVNLLLFLGFLFSGCFSYYLFIPSFVFSMVCIYFYKKYINITIGQKYPDQLL